MIRFNADAVGCLVAGAMLACGVMGGCVPVQGYDTPEAEGRVIDAATAQPVVAAVVRVEGDPPVRGLTDRDGTFLLHAQVRTLWVSILPRDLSPPGGTLSVEAGGYQPQEVALHPGVNVLEIRLNRVNSP